MCTVSHLTSKPNISQPVLEACAECQAGRCCGSCWCCYDRDRRSAVPVMPVIVALRVVCGDVGCDWLSPYGSDRETNLTEVCGGSGWSSRPVRAGRARGG